MNAKQQARFEAKPLTRWEPMEGSMLEQSPTGWFVRYEDYVALRSKVSSQSELIAALVGALELIVDDYSATDGYAEQLVAKAEAALALARDLGVE